MMSRPTYIKTLRDDINDAVTDSDISKSDIFVGWNKKKMDLPCVVITLIDGSEVGQLGGDWSKANPIFRVDVVSRDSAYDAAQTMNEIKDKLLPKGYEKMTEFDSYDDEFEAYIRTINVRLTSTYSF